MGKQDVSRTVAIALIALSVGCTGEGLESEEPIGDQQQGLAGSLGMLLINEIGANEPGGQTSREFVEVVNHGTLRVNLGPSFTLSDTVGVRHVFASSLLQPGKAIVVFGNVDGIPPGLTNAVASSTHDLGLNNAGDTVSLKISSTLLDQVAYPGSLSDSDGVSINVSPDGENTEVYVKHSTISSLPSSPGKRANGADF